VARSSSISKAPAENPGETPWVPIFGVFSPFRFRTVPPPILFSANRSPSSSEGPRSMHWPKPQACLRRRLPHRCPGHQHLRYGIERPDRFLIPCVSRPDFITPTAPISALGLVARRRAPPRRAPWNVTANVLGNVRRWMAWFGIVPIVGERVFSTCHVPRQHPPNIGCCGRLDGKKKGKTEKTAEALKF